MSSDYSQELSNHRLEKAKNLMAEAELLLNNGRYEGSINRSYYAIFNAMRSLLALIGSDSRKHSGVLAFFDRYFVKTGIFDKQFSQIAHSSFDIRQASDYDDFHPIYEEHARIQFERCTKFIAETEQKQSLLLNGKISLPNSK